MEYAEFKENVLKGLKDFYGEGASVELSGALKNNGIRQEAVNIRMYSRDSGIVPVIYLEEFFRMYIAGEMSLGECIKKIVELRAMDVCPPQLAQLSGRLLDWEAVREKVYPALVSTEKNRNLLGRLVSGNLLDMSIIYIIREETDKGECYSVKINRSLLEIYGISREQLHGQAMHNLGKDGYSFTEIGEHLRQSMAGGEYVGGQDAGGMEEGKMYILSNKPKLYGAAGILDRRLVRDMSGGRDCFILPSSIHETLFLLASDDVEQEGLDSVVADVNRTCVAEEERLTNHSYYYDAKAGEIRIKA